MPQAGMTSDLYMNAEDTGTVVPKSALGAPPAPPSPVPPPVQPVVQTQTVTTKSRMADERPDGSVRDTSTEALKPSNDLGFRNLDDEGLKKPAEVPPPSAETKPAEATPQAPPAPAAPEKVYAGKFKSIDELEKGYEESQKAMHKAMEDRAALARQQQATPPPPPPPKTPQQIAAEEASKTAFLAKFVENPEGVIRDYQNQAIQQTQVALAAQEVTHNWRKQNPDLIDHEYFVAAEASRLAASDPEIAKDPDKLIQTATANFRNLTGKLRSEGAKEALTQETRVIPLLSNTAPAAATEQSANKNGATPLSSDDAYSMHIRMLKEQEQKSHRGLRR